MSSPRARGRGGRQGPAFNTSIQNEMEGLNISAKAIPLDKTPVRPSPFTISTSASVSSSESSRSTASIFDRGATPSEGSTSPITPPDESIYSPDPHYPQSVKFDFGGHHPYINKPIDNNDCSEVEDISVGDSPPQETNTSKHDSDSELPRLRSGRKSSHVPVLKDQEQDQKSSDSVRARKGRRATTARTSSEAETPPAPQPISKRRARPRLAVSDSDYLPVPSNSEGKNKEQISEEQNFPDTAIRSTRGKCSSIQKILPVRDFLETLRLPGYYPHDDSPVLDSNQTATTTSCSQERDFSSVVHSEADQKSLPLKYSSSRVTTGAPGTTSEPSHPGSDNAKAEKQYPDFQKREKIEKRPEDINASIFACINEGVKWSKKKKKSKKTDDSDVEQDTKCGWIYVYLHTSDDQKVHVKIGQTYRSVSKRLKEWKNCGIMMEEKHDNTASAFDFYTIVERIVALELTNERRKFGCNHCTQKKRRQGAAKAIRENSPMAKENETVLVKDDSSEAAEIKASIKNHHVEWYYVEYEVAVKIIAKWRNWIIFQKPFNEHGKLTPYWLSRVRIAKKNLENLDWERWTQPSAIERYTDWILAYYVSRGEYFWFLVIIFALLSHIFRGLVDAVLVTIAVLIISYQVKTS